MSDYKDKWIAALRSGQYQQGRSLLCAIRDDGSKTYCCLGVLAELDGAFVDGELFPGVRRGVRIAVDHVSTGMYQGKGKCLSDIRVNVPGASDTLLPWIVAEMNDIKGRTFEEVADFLETVDF